MNQVFKTGDKVQCVRPIASLMEGRVYTVEYVTGRYMHLIDGPQGLWYTDRFVLAIPKVTCKMSAHKEDYRASRANDPATSKGKRKVNKYEEAVLDILKGLYVAQGYTGKEIASLTGYPLNCITPRFAPLRRKEKIKALELDGKVVKRDKQIVWVLA